MADETNTEDAATVAKLETRVEALHNRNREAMNRLNSMGGQLDTSGARIEHMMSKLVEFGLITKLQLLQEQEAWELNLRKQMQPILDQMQQMHMQRMEAARAQGHDVQTQTGLIIPGAGKKV